MMPRPGTQALVVSRADKIVISALFATSLVRNNMCHRHIVDRIKSRSPHSSLSNPSRYALLAPCPRLSQPYYGHNKKDVLVNNNPLQLGVEIGIFFSKTLFKNKKPLI